MIFYAKGLKFFGIAAESWRGIQCRQTLRPGEQRPEESSLPGASLQSQHCIL